MASGAAHFEEAVVVGRFQPFHNRHLDYVLSVKERCDKLLILVVQVASLKGSKAPYALYQNARCVVQGATRKSTDSNPFSFEERKEMIRGSLVDSGLKDDEFSIRKHSLSELLRTDSVFIVTDDKPEFFYKMIWFKLLMRKTEVVGANRDIKKGASGDEIRKLMEEKKPFDHLVPRATHEVVARHLNSGNSQFRVMEKD
jgi:cytidyltransferase-like protein